MKKTQTIMLLAAFIFFLKIGTARAQGVSPPPETTPANTEQTALPPPTVGYDHGFFIESADKKFRMTMSGYIQVYFDRVFVDNGLDTDTFRVRRARLKWSGHIFSENVQYELEYDFALQRLLEAVIQYVQSDEFKIRGGQYHVPFSMEQMTSSSTLQFVDRSILHAYFGIPDEREPGAGFNGQLFDKKFEYDVGIFNGEGINTINQNANFRYAGRLVYNLAGYYGTSFSDTTNSQTPQIALAAGGMYNDTPDPTTIPAGGGAPAADKKVSSLTSDASAKYKGFSLHAAYYYQHVNPDVGVNSHAQGSLGQIGYFIIPTKFEVAGRIAHVFVANGNDLGQYGCSLNYYFYNGHQFKFQLDYEMLTLQNGIALGNDRINHQVQAMLQIKL